MSSLQQMFPFNNALVRRFLNWTQGDEEDTWRNKAVETLIKKLKRSSSEHFATLQLVLNSKSEETPCIAIGRSQDGRVQVSHKKMLPHVMCCRIFRWPDLQSHHELRSLNSCQYPADRRVQNKVCVNPYHYARVDYPSKYPPVGSLRSECGSSAILDEPAASPAISNYSLQSPQPAHMQTGYSPPPSSLLNGHHHHNHNHQPASPNNQLYNYMQQQPLMLQQSPQHQQLPLSDSYYATNTANHSPMSAPAIASPGVANTPATAADGNCEYWCQITYAELNQKIGEPFKGSTPKVYVDGFTNPAQNERFSLGVLSNINRNSTIEMTRQLIKKGVSLENIDGQIYATNLSDRSIFFHSNNCNVENQMPQQAVVRINSQIRRKIFDQRVFERLVQEAFQAQDGRTYERLFSLTEHCIIKMSFVTGWGLTFKRSDVTSLPCWIELHLLKPYALIDQYLRQYVKLTKDIIRAIAEKPDDQHEWVNIAQLMLHLRQALACADCGELVYSRQDVHSDTFEPPSNLSYIAAGFVLLCKLLVAKNMAHRWSDIQIRPVNSDDRPITFGQLVFEAYNSDGVANGESLGDKFTKRLKKKEHHCRCGGKASGNLTCLGQRCACYRKGKGCVNCKCSGCKNPNGTPTNKFRNTSMPTT